MKKAIIVVALSFIVSMPQVSISLAEPTEIEILEAYEAYSKLSLLNAEGKILEMSSDFFNYVTKLSYVESDLKTIARIINPYDTIKKPEVVYIYFTIYEVRIARITCFYEGSFPLKNIITIDTEIKRLIESREILFERLDKIRLLCTEIKDKTALHTIDKARDVMQSSIGLLNEAVKILQSVDEDNREFLRSLREGAEKNKEKDMKK